MCQAEYRQGDLRKLFQEKYYTKGVSIIRLYAKLEKVARENQHYIFSRIY